jgi:hypothetical protein
VVQIQGRALPGQMVELAALHRVTDLLLGEQFQQQHQGRLEPCSLMLLF